MGNTSLSGVTDQDGFMDGRLVDLGVVEVLFKRFKSTPEEILSELFETDTSEGSVLEIDTLKERVDFDGCQERVRLAHLQAVRRRRTARGLTIVLILICAKTKKNQNFLVFALKFLDEVVDGTIVEIF